MKLKRWLQRLWNSQTYGLARSDDGAVRHLALLALFGLPAAAGVCAFLTRALVSPAALLPGATMLAATMFVLVTLTFNRVKDSTSVARPEVGPDPVERAYRAFRIAIASASTALVCAGILIAMIVFDTTPILGRLAAALVIAILVHLGVRLWFTLQAVRQQIEMIVEDRAVPASSRIKPRLIART